MLLNLKIYIDQETYERLVHDAVNSPQSIPQRAGSILRRAYGLPPRPDEWPEMNHAAGRQPADAVPA
jgi:hypothetical protein